MVFLHVTNLWLHIEIYLGPREKKYLVQINYQDIVIKIMRVVINPKCRVSVGITMIP